MEGKQGKTEPLSHPVVWNSLKRSSAAGADRARRSMVTRLILNNTKAAPGPRLPVCLFVYVCDWTRIKAWVWMGKAIQERNGSHSNSASVRLRQTEEIDFDSKFREMRSSPDVNRHRHLHQGSQWFFLFFVFKLDFKSVSGLINEPKRTPAS